MANWHDHGEAAAEGQNPFMVRYPRWFTGRSSVDFCEGNFESMRWIAEPYNTVSALPLVALGVLGVARCLRAEDGSGPEAALFVMLVFVGLGTIALHATLTTLGQAVDEVPMLLLTLWLAAKIEHARGATYLGVPVFLVSVLSVVSYLKFQHYYTCFILSYSSVVAYVVLRLGWLAFSPRAEDSLDAIRRHCIKPLFLFGTASYVLFGFVAWITDMLLCDSVSQLLFGGLLLHPLWHFGSGVGSWCALYATIAAREEFRLLSSSSTRRQGGPGPTDGPGKKGGGKVGGEVGGKVVDLVWLASVLPCVDHGRLLKTQPTPPDKKAL